MAKIDPFASMSDQLPPKGGLRAKLSLGRILTGAIVVASVTFGLAYYVPLSNAHSALAQAHSSLTSSNAGTSVQLEKTTQQLMDTQKERDELAAKLKAVDDAKESAAQTVAAAVDRAKEKLDKITASKQAQFGDSERGLSIWIDDAKLFRPHQVSVHPPGRKVLCAVAAALKDSEGKIQVGGHAQQAEVKNFALKADYATAWDVSAARAVGALRVLESCGLSGERLRAVAHANFSPNKQAEKTSEGQITISLMPEEAP
jgi:chemotaxis protein MotB